jgi:hypothetical protein
VLSGGVVVGSQGIGGRDFAVLREVHTGSWLGLRYQGQGIGTQMRAAVLHLAFEGLAPGTRCPRRSRTTPPHSACRARSDTATTASNGTRSAAARP